LNILSVVIVYKSVFIVYRRPIEMPKDIISTYFSICPDKYKKITDLKNV